jgi:hypothetical protein
MSRFKEIITEMKKAADMIRSTYWSKLEICFYNLHILLVLNMAAASSFQSYNVFRSGPNCDSFCIETDLKLIGPETWFKWLRMESICGLLWTR